MPKTRIQKEEAVIKLKEKLDKATALIFADYKGLSMKQLSELRNNLREQNAQFLITKNSLLKHAMAEADFDGPTATLIAYDDQISPIKILVKAFKDFTIGKVKSGFLDGEVLDEAKIIQLSTLPTKIELRGKVVGVLVAPLQGMVSVLQGNLRNLVYVVRELRSVYALSEIAKVKGGDAQASS